MNHDVQVDPPYGYTAHLAGVAFDDARARVTDALKAQGFGILTEIDVKATMKAKLNREFRRYVILGACNPELAHRALETELRRGTAPAVQRLSLGGRRRHRRVHREAGLDVRDREECGVAAARRRGRPAAAQRDRAHRLGRQKERTSMTIFIVLAVWVVLQVWVLPRLGVPT